MPRFQFVLGDADTVREAGVITSDSFSAALDAVSEHVLVEDGDLLQIGVTGFPPARYKYTHATESGYPTWRPTSLVGNQLAA